jgi:hypothetical protein
MTFKTTAIGLAVASALGLSANVSAYMIDNFDIAQTQLVVHNGRAAGATTAAIPAVTDASNLATDAAITTGQRDIWIGLQTGPVAAGDTSNAPAEPLRVGNVSVGGGTLVGNNETGVISDIWIQWDGSDLAPTGIAAGPNLPAPDNGVGTVIPGTPNLGTAASTIDLSAGNADSFFFDVISGDLAFYFNIEIVDTSGTASFQGGPTPAIGAPGIFPPGGIPFSAFTFASGCTAATCFDTVQSITLKITPSGTARDFEISAFYTGQAPAPGVLSLMGLGLIAVGAARRRKARA